MIPLIRQIAAVVLMNVKGIPQRAWLSIATIGSVALVVAVLSAFLSMAAGFRATANSGGADDIAIVLRSGAEAELNSSVTREQVVILETAPSARRNAQGVAMVSPELYVIVDGMKPGSTSTFSLSLRGVGPNALATRSKFSIVAGRMMQAGTNEIVVGRNLAKEFAGMEIGREVRFGTTVWKVVGQFESGGSVFESEIWGDISVVQSLFNRGSVVQTVRVRMTSPGALDDLRAFSDGDPRLKLDVISEPAFLSKQAAQTSDLIFFIGWPLGIAMAFGALAGAINTMYSSVDARSREIATLRAIGFGGFPAFCGTLTESLALAAIGGIIGTIVAFIFFDGMSASTGFNQVVFSFKFTPGLIGQGILLALIVGFFGGVFPAWRAARVPIAVAYRL